MDFLFKGMNGDASECPSAEDMQRCPFLRNINKPTCFSFTPISLPIPVSCLSLSPNVLFDSIVVGFFS